MVVVVDRLVSSGKDDELSRRKSRIGTDTPTPNKDVTIQICTKMLA